MSTNPVSARALAHFDELFPDRAQSSPLQCGAERRLERSEKPIRTDDVPALGSLQINHTHNVDCLEALRKTGADVFDLIITSPPYWGQRGSAGLGSEPDPRDYISNLVDVLAESLRCIKPDGTLWLNIGDAYNTPINWREADSAYSSLGAEGQGLPPTNSAYTKKRGRRRAFLEKQTPWLQYGNLLALPYRITTALCDRGFLFRGEVIWEKSRPLPEGVCRRPHRRHEGIYIFAKSEGHKFRVKPPVGSVWKLTQSPNKLPHCSTFPVDLPLQCIAAAGCEEPGALICDPFMGSGTTARAAVAKGHNFIGFELDEHMCEVANHALDRDQGAILFG